MRARADREERIYGQTGLAAMLRAGADAREECERLRAAIQNSLVALRAARGVVVSKHEHALLTGAIVGCAEALSGLKLPTLGEPHDR